MGATVRILDETLIDQIAAGEVVERPASVVKELLENSVDAGARAITVSVEDGGRRHIRVTDDGVGMSKEDATLCIQRHATSKIATFNDLIRVETLGFRGEALPSIAAVSKLRIVTRERNVDTGTLVVVEGGALACVEPHGGAPGTTIDVGELFYNVPARRKFLRARQTESARIFETCQRIALAHPELRLVVMSEGRTAREYLPVQTLSERAYQAWGNAAFVEHVLQRDSVRLEAVLASADQARQGARQLFLYVNGRSVTDRRLARAVAFAYGDALPPGHYPRGIVALQLPPEEVDMNAHPQKTEVRFTKPAHVLDQVTRMLSARLQGQSPSHSFWQNRLGPAGPTTADPSGHVQHVQETQAPYATEAPQGHSQLLVRLRDRYLVCEKEDALYVIDARVASEEARYRALAQAFESAPLKPQTLLFPDRIEVAPETAALVERCAPLLTKLGFEWSSLGDDTLVVRAIPALAGESNAAQLFEEMLQCLQSSSERQETRALRRVAAFFAASHVLTEASARTILQDLNLEEDAPPHDAVVARVPLATGDDDSGAND